MGIIRREERMKGALCVGILLAVALASGCSMTTEAKDFNGLTTPDGKATHVSTTNIALHLLFTNPVVGDATLPQTVADHTAAVKKTGASKIRIVQSNVTTYWWILGPITLVIHPVVTTVASDAIK